MKVRGIVCAGVFAVLIGNACQAEDKSLDPRGKIHIPIGIANTLDTLKTFVEAEGSFSPGFGSYGIYFWVFDYRTGKLTAPTMDGLKCEHGLRSEGYLIPWSVWRAGSVEVKTEVCEVCEEKQGQTLFIVGTRAHLRNTTRDDCNISLYVALRPLGPAGWPVNDLAVSDDACALLVDGRAALISNVKPTAAGVLPTDTIGQLALVGKMPADKRAASPAGDCSGALRFDLTLQPEQTRTLGFVCPVLPGRRAVAHQWDGKSEWAQFDEAKLHPPEGGMLQPDPGLAYYRGIKADALFDEAVVYWKDLVGRSKIKLPDPRWSECFAAIIGHVAMCMNEGAPDVSVVNYNVFNRDGVYVANILQKSGHFELAAQAIDYFLSHPFNGRVYPEADNPGQILWIMGEHWRFTRDRQWLERVYPSAKKLAAMVKYYRTAPGPHWVCPTSLDFGDALPPDKRQELKPGRCDGHHPEYTEAFDIAGLRKAVMLAEAMNKISDAEEWRKLADSLFESYDKRFGPQLPKGYGSYSVLWPCNLYPFTSGKAYEQFNSVAAQKPVSWRYFPLATAHQGLFTGNREAAYKTLELHLDHEQIRGWYAFDEGGKSGSGGWAHVRTTWDGSVAMPHGWAIAEMWLLLRDSLLFEDGNRLVLLSGVSPEWFGRGEDMAGENLPTCFGPCSFAYSRTDRGGQLTLSGRSAPPEGFVLRLPRSLQAKLTADGKAVDASGNGDFMLPAGTTKVEIAF